VSGAEQREQAMANPKEPPFDDEDGSSEIAEIGKALHFRIEEFAQEHDLSDGEISLLLVDIAVKSRMADYMLSVEKPSGAGLKLELDRMRHEAEQLIRAAKKVADGYVAHTKEVLKQAEQAEQDEQKS
jgi:hypothetical protein